MGAVIAVMAGADPGGRDREGRHRGILPKPLILISLFPVAAQRRQLNGLIERLAPVKNLEDFPGEYFARGSDQRGEVWPYHRPSQPGAPPCLYIPFLFLYTREDGAFRLTWDDGANPALAARILDADLVIATTAYDALS